MYKYKAVVKNVVDGDTVDLSVDLGFDVWYHVRVRVDGIDTPEKWHPYGKVVKKYVKQVLEGKEVFITSNGRDKYGRYLVDITMAGFRETFNQHLIDQKMAKAYGGGSRDGTWTEAELAQTGHRLLK